MNKIWLSHYQSGVPHSIEPLAFQNLVDIFTRSCESYPEHIAFVHLDYEVTFKRIKELAERFAAYLQHIGLQKGDKIAIMLPNTLQYPVVLFGSLMAGLSIINTNPLYTAPEVSHQLKDSGAKAIVILENFSLTLQKAKENLPELKHVILTNVGDLFPWPKKLLINAVIKYVKKMIPHHQLSKAIPFLQTIKHSYPYQSIHIDSDDLAFIQYTGGTTGVSKGAMLSHRNMVSNVMQASSWIKPEGFNDHDRIVTALPLYHVFSLTANLLTFFYLGAKNLLITNPNDVKSFIKQISHFQMTAFTGVNTLFNVLLHHKDFNKIDFSKLKLTLSGGMALQSSVAQKWNEMTHTPILEAYGLTETSPAVCINPLYVHEYNGSVGLPLPSTEISLRDNEGHEVELGKSGEISVKGPQVMQGYWNNPQETQNVFWPDGYLKTGDIATIDDKGMVYLVDRKKDMILVSGFNVYPNEVEQVIGMIPGVLEVGVIGVKVDEGSEKVKACIVKTDPNLTAEDIRQHCKQYLTAYKVPKIIEFYDTLPKSNVGKILRRSLS
ncbi:MAG TPA: long-chain-fatty-acid--CoA ligase [Legionellales bacterium]|nr:long-chain-fatty-acid--CoA ligase [Legionellales bacterium]